MPTLPQTQTQTAARFLASCFARIGEATISTCEAIHFLLGEQDVVYKSQYIRFMLWAREFLKEGRATFDQKVSKGDTRR